MLLPKQLKMVSLGFVKDARQLPLITPRVCLRRAAITHGQGSSTLSTWTHRRKRQSELRWDVPASFIASGNWAEPLAETVFRLNWTSWILCTDSIRETCSASVTESLSAWGRGFWPGYTADAVVYIEVGDSMREDVYACVREWQKAYSHVTFQSAFDIDLQVKQERERWQNASTKERAAILWNRIRERF